MNPPAKLSDLLDALLLDSDEHVTRFDRATVRLVMVENRLLRAIEEGDDESLRDLPDWRKEDRGPFQWASHTS